MIKIFDSHSHYDSEQFDADRDGLLTELFSGNVGRIMTCGDSLESSERCIALAEKYENIYASAGIHPECASAAPDDWEIKLEALIKKSDKIRAVGEIGLDYHYDIPKNIQFDVFVKQLEIARRLKLPVIMHDREAHGDMLAAVRKYRPSGVMHCYSGSPQDAEALTEIGIYIGFTGVVTFSNARRAAEAAAAIPLEKMLIETDAPYLAPVPFRGKRNRSDYLIYVAEKLAQIRGLSTEEIIKITDENACRLFGI